MCVGAGSRSADLDLDSAAALSFRSGGDVSCALKEGKVTLRVSKLGFFIVCMYVVEVQLHDYCQYMRRGGIPSHR